MDRAIMVLENQERDLWEFHQLAARLDARKGRKSKLYSTTLAKWAAVHSILCDLRALAQDA